MRPTKHDGIAPATERADTTDVVGIPANVDDASTGPLSGVQLLCVAGDDLGKTFAVVKVPALIGRGEGTVSLRAKDVSRKHALIYRHDGRFWIEDLESSNGTYLNGITITGTRELRFGDRLQIGSSILVFARSDELEQRLRQLQKLEAMGALVKGISHDFNNTLQVLIGGIDELKTIASDPEMQRILDGMMHAATSGSGLVRRLLRIGRDKPDTTDLVDLGATVRSSIAMAKRVMPASVRIDIGEVADVLVRGSRTELEQAILNILVNARDAMPDGGRISVTTTIVNLDRASSHARHLFAGGTFVELVIRDDGIGMTDETLARAFEPFFTTKAGTGTGLGLAMMYSTIKAHGGTVVIESTPDTGTKVAITLPAA